MTTEGKLVTYQSILCDVPDLPIHDAKIASFYIPGEGIDKTRYGLSPSLLWDNHGYLLFFSMEVSCSILLCIFISRTLLRVKISYSGESPPSEALDLTIYDSLCWGCDSPLACEPRPTQSCNVLSEPFDTSDPFGTSSFNAPTLGFAQSNSPLQYSPSDVSGFTPSAVPGGLISPGVPIRQQQQHHQPHPQLSSPCFLPKENGPCRNDVLRYYFDSVASKCRPFIYGGCQGNPNNFLTEQDCLTACVSSPTVTAPGSLTAGSAAVSSNSSPFAASLVLSGPSNNRTVMQPHENTIPDKCMQGNNPGPCQEEIIRYYYDTVMSKCRPFIYGGCGGNSNNFQAKSACVEECERGQINDRTDNR